MGNVVAMFREAVPADYVEVSPGLWALSWDEARLAPGSLCNDPIEGATQYNRHLFSTRTNKPTQDGDLAKIDELFAECFSQNGIYSMLIAAAFINSVDPTIPLPKSFGQNLSLLNTQQKYTIFFVLNRSHLAQTALNATDLARLMSLKTCMM